MHQNLEKGFRWIFAAEGGLSNNPADKGGLTKYGITKASYPQLDIERLTLDDAKRIYQRDFWNAVRADELPNGLDIVLFDAAVNHGPKTGIALLQQALNRFARPKLVEDGDLGPVTFQAVQGWARKEQVLVEWFLAYRVQRYMDIVMKDPSQRQFLLGWIKRMLDLEAFILLEK